MFIVQHDGDFITECCYLENHINSLYEEFTNFLVEQNEDYLFYITKAEESIIERFLDK